MANVGIYNALLQSPKSYADYQNEDMQRQQNALALQTGQQNMLMGQAKLDEYQRGVQRQNELLNFQRSLAGDISDEDRIKAYRNRGYLTEADSLEKGMLERQKTRSTIDKDDAETKAKQVETAHKMLDYGIQGLQTIGDPTTAIDYINQGVARGYWGMQDAQRMVGGMPKDQQEYQKWRATQLRQLLSAKDQLPKVESRNLGGFNEVYTTDPLTGQVIVTNKAQITASPDAILREAGEERRSQRADVRAREGLALQREAAGGIEYKQDQDGNWIALPKKPAMAGKITAMPVLGPDGKPIGGGGGKLTEDQAKATGWLIQAENAWKNMQSVYKENPDAAKPGFNDVLASVPGGAGPANSLRSPDRQKFMQASSSLSESLLRAATGAGINAYEAQQKIDELTPKFGEHPTVTKQKMDSIPLYLAALRARSGPGAKSADKVLGGQASPEAPRRISNDADYNALPSGAEFIAPDGSRRRKP